MNGLHNGLVNGLESGLYSRGEGMANGLVFDTDRVVASSLLRGVAAYWKLDQTKIGSGLWARDELSLYNALTILLYKGNPGHNVSLSASNVITQGKISTGLNFVASLSGFIDANPFTNGGDSTILELGPTDHTISVWIKLTSLPVQFANIFMKGAYGATRTYNLLRVNSTGRVDSGVSYNFDGAYDFLTSNTILKINTWYHILTTRNVSSRKIETFINGVKDTAVTASLGTLIYNYAPNRGCNIGATVGGVHFFNGVISELGIWTRALQEHERIFLYNKGFGVSYPFVLN